MVIISVLKDVEHHLLARMNRRKDCSLHKMLLEGTLLWGHKERLLLVKPINLLQNKWSFNFTGDEGVVIVVCTDIAYFSYG